MSRRKKPFLLLVFFFAAIFLLLSFWVIRRNSTKSNDSLMIHDVVISTDVDDTSRLTGAVSRFPYGSREVYLRFNYSKAALGSEIKLLWFCGEKLVEVGECALSEPSGAKVYCLMLENGQPLPRSPYSIAIVNKSERLSDFLFEIY